MTRILRGACVAIACASIGSAMAAGSDELWEVSTQMNMAGMPAGMGSQKSQVCTEKGDPKKAMTRGNDKCKVKDFKQSGNSVHMEMSCPEGDAVMDTTYNAAHSEYKGTMKMTSKHGDMTMTMAGRKIGTCDAKQAKAEREEKVAAVHKQAAEGQAMLAAERQKSIDACNRSPETMQGGAGLAQWGGCAPGAQGIYCARTPTAGADADFKRVITACTAARERYCARFATAEGLAKAKADPEGARICNLDSKQLVSAHCSQALKTENFSYLYNDFCSEQKRTLARQHCAGRAYTAKPRTPTEAKYSDFCNKALGGQSLEAADEGESKPQSMAEKVKADPKAAVQEGVSQGINKLKGLFGR
jgi:hypothetical protein